MDGMKASEGKRIGSSRADIVLWGYSRIESERGERYVSLNHSRSHSPVLRLRHSTVVFTI